MDIIHGFDIHQLGCPVFFAVDAVQLQFLRRRFVKMPFNQLVINFFVAAGGQRAGRQIVRSLGRIFNQADIAAGGEFCFMSASILAAFTESSKWI